MSVLQLPTSEVFQPLLEPARYKGGWGGRGSGKSRFFGGLLIEDSLRYPGENAGEGLRSVCIREVQKSLKQSAKKLLEDELTRNGLGEKDGFKVYNDCIKTPGDGIVIFQGMQDHTADSIKSLEGFKRAWCEEAQTMSRFSMQLLRPTIREEDSELWFSWNPRFKHDAVDLMLRGINSPSGSTVVRANWSDNPWFPDVLNQERLDCLRDDPEQYDYIWEGGYMQVSAGAYYAKHLIKAQKEKRTNQNINIDPMYRVRVYCDIGGTGARSDAFTMWAVQYVGHEVRIFTET